MSGLRSGGVGTGVLEEGSRLDPSRLRAERRRRCLDAMERHGLDALVLGREANARFAAGARRLWTAGTRPFGPGCVVVGQTGSVHLLSSWDDGIPPEVGHDQLFGITWNGANLFANLAAIPGLTSSRRIGVDGMSQGMAQLLGTLAPGAQLVDASAVLMAARRRKSPDEVACLQVAAAVADGALEWGGAHLRPGVNGAHLAGRVAARAAELGVTAPDVEATFAVTSPPPWPASTGEADPGRTGARDGFDAGSLVTGEFGVLFLGYEGVASDTWCCPAPGTPLNGYEARAGELWERRIELARALADACRPGRPVGDLLEAYRRSGESLPAAPVAHGVGLGMEPPLVGQGLPPDAGAAMELEPGMVLCLNACVRHETLGSVRTFAMVLVDESGAEPLSG